MEEKANLQAIVRDKQYLVLNLSPPTCMQQQDNDSHE